MKRLIYTKVCRVVHAAVAGAAGDGFPSFVDGMCLFPQIPVGSSQPDFLKRRFMDIPYGDRGPAAGIELPVCLDPDGKPQIVAGDMLVQNNGVESLLERPAKIADIVFDSF
jgi:hypothetical protein